MNNNFKLSLVLKRLILGNVFQQPVCFQLASTLQYFCTIKFHVYYIGWDMDGRRSGAYSGQTVEKGCSGDLISIIFYLISTIPKIYISSTIVEKFIIEDNLCNDRYVKHDYNIYTRNKIYNYFCRFRITHNRLQR